MSLSSMLWWSPLAGVHWASISRLFMPASCRFCSQGCIQANSKRSLRWTAISRKMLDCTELVKIIFCSLCTRTTSLAALYLQLQALPSSGRCVLPVNACSEEKQWVSGGGEGLYFVTGKIFSALIVCALRHMFNKHPLSLQIFHDSWSLWNAEEI